jgi:SEC-C motif
VTALKDRFEALIRTFDGFEHIDTLLGANAPKGKNRADYLLCRREIIVEQKSLDVDPVYRPQNYAKKLMERGRLIAYGTVSTKLFSKELQREFLLDLAKNVDAVVAKADQQTEDTRGIFSIPDALGVLVILNERAQMLDPQVIHYALSNVFQKKAADGSLRYPANDGVILIPEAHAIRTPLGPRIPLMRFTNPHCRANERFLQFSDVLFKAWSKFNGVPLIEKLGDCGGSRPAAPRSPCAGIPRTAPCPCGSGKKFKHCHGRV